MNLFNTILQTIVLQQYGQPPQPSTVHNNHQLASNYFQEPQELYKVANHGLEESGPEQGAPIIGDISGASPEIVVEAPSHAMALALLVLQLPWTLTLPMVQPMFTLSTLLMAIIYQFVSFHKDLAAQQLTATLMECALWVAHLHVQLDEIM